MKALHSADSRVLEEDPCQSHGLDQWHLEMIMWPNDGGECQNLPVSDGFSIMSISDHRGLGIPMAVRRGRKNTGFWQKLISGLMICIRSIYFIRLEQIIGKQRWHYFRHISCSYLIDRIFANISCYKISLYAYIFRNLLWFFSHTHSVADGLPNVTCTSLQVLNNTFARNLISSALTRNRR